MYFSRSAIPYGALPEGAKAEGTDVVPLKHRGIYAYRREGLLELASRKVVALESTERLEQLRAMHYGMVLAVVETPRDGVEVNTPEDYERFVRLVRGRGQDGAQNCGEGGRETQG